MDCTIRVAKTKALNSFAKLICVFVFAYAISRFSDNAAHSLDSYKVHNNPQVCDNHRDISLLSIAGKILAKILLNRLNAHLDQAGLIPESQCGLRKDRGTIDMIFTARQLQEKCQEQNADLKMTFVDLTKAFDTVSRDGPLENNGKVWLSTQIHSDGAAVS